MSLQKILVLGVLLLDILGIGVLIPAYPEMISRFNTKDTFITLGLTVYSLCAFFATPLLGQLSDKHGRKGLLVLCVAGSALSFVALLLTHNVWFYILSRIINGITGGNFSILQAIMTDISKDHQERTKNFGLLGALFGLGFIIGPLLGGLLLNLGLEWVFGLCFAFSIIEMLLLVFLFKETHAPDPTRQISYNPFPVFKKYLLHGKRSWLFISMLLVGVAGFAFMSISSVYLSSTYGVSGQTIGYVLAGIGVITAINQGLLLPKFWLKRRTTKQLLHISLVAMMIIFIIMGLAHTFILLIAFWLLLTPFNGLVQPVYGSEIMKHADKKYTGEITGFMGSIQSLTMFLGPLLGTLALGINVSVLFASALLVVGGLLLAGPYYIREAERKNGWYHRFIVNLEIAL